MITFIYGAPAMAPLLFPNLMLLGVIGLWQFGEQRNTVSSQPVNSQADISILP